MKFEIVAGAVVLGGLALAVGSELVPVRVVPSFSVPAETLRFTSRMEIPAPEGEPSRTQESVTTLRETVITARPPRWVTVRSDGAKQETPSRREWNCGSDRPSSLGGSYRECGWKMKEDE